MESIKRTFNNTVVVFVLAILAVASIVAAIFINIDTNVKQSLVKGKEITDETIAVSFDATTDLGNQSGDVIKNTQIQELNSLMSELQTITNYNSSITNIIDRYIEVRYNYTDGPDKEHILNELNDITRKFFLGQVDNSLNYLKGDSKAEIIKRYATTDSASVSMPNDTSIVTFVYIVNINNANKVIEFTVFKESGKWVIYDEKEIGTVELKDIKTRELLAPDTIKSTNETSTQSTSAQEEIKNDVQ